MFYTSLISEATFNSQDYFVIEPKQKQEIYHICQYGQNKSLTSHCETSYFFIMTCFCHFGNLVHQPSDSDIYYKRHLHLDVLPLEDIVEIQQCYARYCCFLSY